MRTKQSKIVPPPGVNILLTPAQSVRVVVVQLPGNYAAGLRTGNFPNMNARGKSSSMATRAP